MRSPGYVAWIFHLVRWIYDQVLAHLEKRQFDRLPKDPEDHHP